MLVVNFGRLFELEGNRIFLNLDVVREESLILFLLIFFISRMSETSFRRKTLIWLKVLLFVFAAGAIAKERRAEAPRRLQFKH